MRAAVAVCATVVACAGAAQLPVPADAARGGTLTVTAEANPDFLDSGFAYSQESWQILANIGNGLLAFKRAPGRAGAQVVPDLALQMPTVTDGGRTLTFFLRPGVRFGPPVAREVKASDVKATLERLFLIPSRGAPLYSNIVGADALLRTKRGGLSGVTADDVTGRVAIRLSRPDPSFVEVLALPFAFVVPRETPPVDQSTEPPVGTGPYFVKSYDPKREIVLERNPDFQPWSPGTAEANPDRIVVKTGVPAGDALGRIAEGTADYTQSRLTPARVGALQKANRVRVHRNVEPATYYFFMNVNLAPFDDVGVRRAVNYAIDRRHIVQLFGGQAVATQQVLPPSVPGYRKATPYPGPDLERARRMIERSGKAGARVTVWGYNTDPSPAVTTYLAGVLREIGLDARTRFLDKGVFLDRVADRRARMQIGYARWQGDFPDGVDYFGLLLDGRTLRSADNLNYSYLDDPHVNRSIQRARAVSDPRARAEAWTGVEREVLRQAPWAPFVNTVRTDVTSPRIRGYVYHQTFGFLWMKASVR
jgi:peptide/nickel transport system substrate-binding protein